MALTATISAPEGGSVTIHVWVGWIGGRQHIADVYHRLGQEGAGVQSLGMRAKPTRHMAYVFCADYATALATHGILNRLRAQVINVTDPYLTVNRCVVHDSTASVQTGRHGYDGTSYPYRVECDLLLEYIGDAPSISPIAVT